MGRVTAWILLVAALVAVGRDGLLFMETGTYTPVALGALFPSAVAATQNLIERYLSASLWSPLATLLGWPAWAVLGGAAAIIALLFAHPRRRKWRSGSLG
jgi:hypothetical protein